MEKTLDTTIDSLLSKLDIVEVVSSYIPLKRAGRNFKATCPFHNEKTPSFNVDPERGFYHCFGCKAGGSVFNFIMAMEKLSFPETLKMLAEQTGIALPESGAEDIDREAENLYHANQVALEFYQQCLFETRAGEKALAYMKSRDFNEETIRRFQIGYSPNRWDGLIQKAKRTDINLQWFLKAGLDVFYLEISDFKGAIVDTTVAVEYNAWKHVGFGLALDFFRAEVEAEDDDALPGVNFIGNIEFGVSVLMFYA